MLFNIIACVLAVVVPLAAALVLRMSVQNELLQRDRTASESYYRMRDTWTTSCGQLSARVEKLESASATSTNAHLAAELADLAGDVEALAKTVKKNFGRVYAELHQSGMVEDNARQQRDIETPEEVRARLRAAHGLPKMGANGAGAEGE